jgi:hypothetical protein
MGSGMGSERAHSSLTRRVFLWKGRWTFLRRGSALHDRSPISDGRGKARICSASATHMTTE